MKKITKSPAKGRTRKAGVDLSTIQLAPTESEQNAGHTAVDDQVIRAGGGEGGPTTREHQGPAAPSPQPIRRKAGSRKVTGPMATRDEMPTATTLPRKGEAKKAEDASLASRGTPSSQSSAGHTDRADQNSGAGGGEDRANSISTARGPMPDLADHIATLRELAVQRRACISLQVKIDNGTRALVRRACGFSIDLPEKERAAINKRAAAIVKAVEDGDKIADPVAATLATFILTAAQGRAPVDAFRTQIEKDMAGLSEHMPVYHFVEELRGFGALGLAIIVGEAGDIGQYGNPGKLWKRMGLARIGGRNQGNPGKGASAEDWILHGYNKQRRSMMWQIMDSMMKHQWTGDKDEDGKNPLKSKKSVAVPAHAVGPYGEVYGAKKADYMARVEATKDLPATDPEKWTPLRAERAARRYTEKRLLRNLWRAWRAANATLVTGLEAPSAEIPVAAE